MREKVFAKEQGIVSKKLAIIDINVPIEFNENELFFFSEIDTEKTIDLFEELEFKTILQRVLSLSETEFVTNKELDSEKDELFSEGQLDMFSENINSQNEKIEIEKRYSTTKDYDFLLDKIRENGKCSIQILSNNLSNFNDSVISFSIYRKG